MLGFVGRDGCCSFWQTEVMSFGLLSLHKGKSFHVVGGIDGIFSERSIMSFSLSGFIPPDIIVSAIKN